MLVLPQITMPRPGSCAHAEHFVPVQDELCLCHIVND